MKRDTSKPYKTLLDTWKNKKIKNIETHIHTVFSFQESKLYLLIKKKEKEKSKSNAREEHLFWCQIHRRTNE